VESRGLGDVYKRRPSRPKPAQASPPAGYPKGPNGNICPLIYSGLTKTGTALPRPGSKGTIP
ncbi:hypothetical protein ACRPFF_11670, partial [Neisseria sp. SLRRB23]|uniref:hypothetical protein n=1 Tax=Neisseria sp. SLRRB23 TaxID=3435199 RepID=UPI003D7F48FB